MEEENGMGEQRRAEQPSGLDVSKGVRKAPQRAGAGIRARQAAATYGPALLCLVAGLAIAASFLLPVSRRDFLGSVISVEAHMSKAQWAGIVRKPGIPESDLYPLDSRFWWPDTHQGPGRNVEPQFHAYALRAPDIEWLFLHAYDDPQGLYLTIMCVRRLATPASPPTSFSRPLSPNEQKSLREGVPMRSMYSEKGRSGIAYWRYGQPRIWMAYCDQHELPGKDLLKVTAEKQGNEQKVTDVFRPAPHIRLLALIHPYEPVVAILLILAAAVLLARAVRFTTTRA